MNYESILCQALDAYGLHPRDTRLLGHSDKRVYRVDAAEGAYVLSMYTPADGKWDARNAPYNRPEAILSEANLMARLATEAPELGTQRILASRSGALIERVCDVPVRVTSYIPGDTLNEGGPHYGEQARRAGIACARLHDFCDGAGPEICQGRPEHRQSYFRDILSEFSRAHDARRITDARFAAIERGGAVILDCMDALTAQNQTGFVHTDLRSANFIDDGNRAVPIDFSRGVLGFPLYDLGEMCMHMGEAPIQRQILSGYSSIRPLDEFRIHCIETFAVMFIFDICAEFLGSGQDDWLQANLPRIERYFIPGLTEGSLLPRDFR